MAVTIHDPFKDHRVITSLRLAEYPTLTPDDPTSQNRYVLYFLPQDIESGIVSAEIGAPEPEYDSQGELVWNLLNHNAPGNQLRHWDVPLFAFTKMDELIEVIYKRHFQHYVLSENGSGRREWTYLLVSSLRTSYFFGEGGVDLKRLCDDMHLRYHESDLIVPQYQEWVSGTFLREPEGISSGRWFVNTAVGVKHGDKVRFMLDLDGVVRYFPLDDWQEEGSGFVIEFEGEMFCTERPDVTYILAGSE